MLQGLLNIFNLQDVVSVIYASIVQRAQRIRHKRGFGKRLHQFFRMKEGSSFLVVRCSLSSGIFRPVSSIHPNGRLRNYLGDWTDFDLDDGRSNIRRVPESSLRRSDVPYAASASKTDEKSLTGCNANGSLEARS